MNAIKSKPNRTSLVSRLMAGCVLVAGFAMASMTPALADGWRNNNGWHNNGGHYDHGGYYNRGGYYGGYYGGPSVVYVQPRPVIVQPRPVYVAPPPVYYQPAPVYAAPSLNVVIPLRIH